MGARYGRRCSRQCDRRSDSHSSSRQPSTSCQCTRHACSCTAGSKHAPCSHKPNSVVIRQWHHWRITLCKQRQSPTQGESHEALTRRPDVEEEGKFSERNVTAGLRQHVVVMTVCLTRQMRGTLLGSLAGVSWLKEAATSTFLVFLFKDSQAQPEPNTCSNNVNPKEQGNGGSMCQQGYTAQSLATVASSYGGSSLRELGLELVKGAKLLVNGCAQLA